MKNRKGLIIIIVVINILFVYSLLNMFYFKKASFDNNKKANIDCSKIQKIETDEGNWEWNNTLYDFYDNYKVTLSTNEEIDEFCKIIKSSKAKYIDNLKSKNWVNIYFTNNGKEELKIELHHSFSDEIYFEFENHTFDGGDLANFIKNKMKKIN